MKAIIKIVTASPEFNEDQKKIIKRIMMVLIEHDLSCYMKIKNNSKKDKVFQIKGVG